MTIIDKKTKKNKVYIKTLLLTMLLFLLVPLTTLGATALPSTTQNVINGKPWFIVYNTSAAKYLLYVIESEETGNVFYKDGSYIVNTKSVYYSNYAINNTTYEVGQNYNTNNNSGSYGNTASFVGSIDRSSFDIYSDANKTTVVFANSETGTTEPPPTEPDPTEPDPTEPPLEGGENNMFNNLTTTAITTEATTWANHFDSLLLVVVGVGIGFACVRFVKSMFF